MSADSADSSTSSSSSASQNLQSEEDQLQSRIFTQIETDFGKEPLKKYLDELGGVGTESALERVGMIRKVSTLLSNLKGSVNQHGSSPLFRLQIVNVSAELKSLLLESFRLISLFHPSELTPQFEELVTSFGDSLHSLISGFRKWDEWEGCSFEKEFACMLIPTLDMLDYRNWLFIRATGELLNILLSFQCSIHDAANWERGASWSALHINVLSTVMGLIRNVGDFSFQFYLLKLATSWLGSVPLSQAHKLLKLSFPNMSTNWRLQLLGETVCDNVIVSSLYELDGRSIKSTKSNRSITFASCFELGYNGKEDSTDRVKWIIINGESGTIQFITTSGEILSTVRIDRLLSFGFDGRHISDLPPMTFHLRGRNLTHYFRTVDGSRLFQKFKELGLNRHDCRTDGCRRMRTAVFPKKPAKLTPRELKIAQGYNALPIKRVKK